MRTLKGAMLAGISLLTVVSPAWGQDTAVMDSQDTSLASNDIIVTARRRDESIQDVPLVVQAVNRWAITTDMSHRTQTLNNKQALPNPDGSFTFVVSPKDPGVYNWIDTVGHREGFLNPRWQRLSEEAASNEPSVRVQLVKIAALPTLLPENTRFVTPHERELQRSERAAGFAKRCTP